MAKTMNQKIQVLRAVAIIAVVMIHTCPGGLPQVFVRPFINFAVGTFLFLSGYLTNTDTINTKAFYKRRILRVLIPYIVWTILYTAVGFYSNGVDAKQFLVNLLLAKSAPTMYYVLVYIQFVLLTPVLGKLLKTRQWWLGFAIAPLSLTLRYYWVLTGISHNYYVSAVWDICCLAWFTFYYLGLYLRNVETRPTFHYRPLLAVYAASLVIQMLEGFWWYRLGADNFGTQLKLSSLLTTSIFILLAYCYITQENTDSRYKALVLIGNYSFGIYLSQFMFLKLLDAFLPIWQAVPFPVNSVVILSISLLFVVIGHKLLGDKAARYLGLY